MDNLKNMVTLIDADNTQVNKIKSVLQEISTRGRIVVKRAYGNWKKPALKSWESELKHLAIKAEQQFDYVTGKNATDMALVIDAIELLHMNIYDAFVIVASDSDYTPLAIKLRESGVYVIGVGEKKTPDAFRNACDEFLLIENMTDGIEKTAPKQKKAAVKETEITEPEVDPSLEEIHTLLKIACETYQDDEGYAFVSSAGIYIKRAKPDFDVRTYGYTKLTEFITAFPKKYDVKKYPGQGKVSIYAYKCL